MKEEESLSWIEVMKRPIRLIERDNEIRLNKPGPLTLWDLLRLRKMAENPELEKIWDSPEETSELAPERTEEKKRVLEEGLESEDVKCALITFENLEIETKGAGKSKEFEERKLDVIYYPWTLLSAIDELKAWWKENRDG